jgi:hypothetical protein
MPTTARVRLYLQAALAQYALTSLRSPVTVAPVAEPPTTVAELAPPPPDRPLRLTDDQLAAVLQAAEPLAVEDRSAFLEEVAAALRGQELGDGTIYRTIATVQKRYWDPPVLAPGPWWGHQP